MRTSQRVLDVVVSAVGLVLASPLLLALALWVRLDSPGPVLYRGIRIGKGGTPFQILKFRTMTVDADRRGSGITTHNDPRVTRAGAVLRRYKLDELPQLWNVLRGDMSLVGPRPEDPRYVQLYTPAQRAVLAVTPGITSAASLTFRHEEAILDGSDWEQTYTQVVLPRKLEIELRYLHERTLWTDLGIVAKTFLAVLKKESDTHVA